MSHDRLQALAGFFGMIIFYCIPLIIIDAILFVWPCAYLLKRCEEAPKRASCNWYLVGLLLLEALLLKICVFEAMPLLLSLFVFIYLVTFTRIYFNDTFKAKDKKLSQSDNS